MNSISYSFSIRNNYDLWNCKREQNEEWRNKHTFMTTGQQTYRKKLASNTRLNLVSRSQYQNRVHSVSPQTDYLISTSTRQRSIGQPFSLMRSCWCGSNSQAYSHSFQWFRSVLAWTLQSVSFVSHSHFHHSPIKSTLTDLLYTVFISILVRSNLYPFISESIYIYTSNSAFLHSVYPQKIVGMKGTHSPQQCCYS